MPDTVIVALSELHKKIDNGFERVHNRLDKVSDDLTENLRRLDSEFTACKESKEVCKGKLNETIAEVRSKVDNHITTNGVHEEHEKRSKEFWRNVLVAVISAGATGALFFIYILVVSHPIK